MDHFETLVRSVLLRPDHPAVLLLGHFSPQTHQTHGFAGPDHWHAVVAHFYDLPYLTIKPALFPLYMHDPAAVAPFFVDPVLSSPLGHALLADVLAAFFQAQTCAAWARATGAAFDAAPAPAPAPDPHALFGGVGQRKGVPEPLEPDPSHDDRPAPHAPRPAPAPAHVPPGRIATRPGARVEEIAPYCVSANDLINPLPPSLFFGSGWLAHHGAGALRVAAHYWYSALPTSRLRVPLQVGAGDVGVYYLEEPGAVVGAGSAVECWVDDNYAGARVLENARDIGEAAPRLVMIDAHVTRGSHFVECVLLGEEGQSVPPFKIIGIFAS